MSSGNPKHWVHDNSLTESTKSFSPMMGNPHSLAPRHPCCRTCPGVSNPLRPPALSPPSRANRFPFLSHPLAITPCPSPQRPPRPAMAERVPSTPPRPPPPGPQPTTTTTTTPNDSLPPPALANPAPRPRPTETYVIQVPKEQIYRVPPPENAMLVEKYRNNHNNRRQQRPILPCLKWTIGTALVIGILAAIIAITYFSVVRPADPSFSVTRLALKDPNRRAGSLRKPEYDFTMTVVNPSLRMGYSYKAGGKAILLHDAVEIAVGKTKAFDQRHQNTTTFHLVLQGAHVVLPKEIKSSLKGSKDIIPLKLMIEFSSVGKTIGKLAVGKGSMDVTCHTKVSELAKVARVVSQECKTKFT